MLLDLNADLGEGVGTDAALMPLITSANISCGFHAGTKHTITEAFALAKKFGVRVGAHPGYQDREHFGRREMALRPAELASIIRHQLIGLFGFAELRGQTVGYVKPHGALYHQANREREYAAALLNAVQSIDLHTAVPVVGLPISVLDEIAKEQGVPFIPEGFADRRYRPDGSLVPRTEPDALLHDPKEVVEQVEWLVGTQGVRTICVHGDTPGAVEFVRAVRGFLLDRGHELRAFA